MRMSSTLITTNDLWEFKRQLLKEFKNLMHQTQDRKLKRYLRSSEVMDLLQISRGTLQHLRLNGTLPYVKIGGLIFYEVTDIQRVMDTHRIHHNTGFSK